MTDTMTRLDVEAFAAGYLECAAWLASFDDDGEAAWFDTLKANGIDYRDGEASAQYLLSLAGAELSQALLPDVIDFVRSNEADLLAAVEAGRDAASLGRDFYFNRCRHGAGYWDRGLGELGERLSEAAHVYGECGIQAWLEDGAWTFCTY